MLNFTFKKPGALAFGVAVAAAALTLAACGGGGGDDGGGSTTTPPVTVTPPVGVTTAGFIAVVQRLIGMTDETSEPAAITDVVATTSETEEPIPNP